MPEPDCIVLLFLNNQYRVRMTVLRSAHNLYRRITYTYEGKYITVRITTNDTNTWVSIVYREHCK